MHDEDERDHDLDRVVAAVSSGDPIDWAMETSRRPDLAPLLDELRVVDSVAAEHRRSSSEPGDEEPASWGPLRLVERIGRGGFSDVYRAFDPRLQTEVALKLMRPGSASEARMIQEGRRMARVRHPNVLVVHGADEHQGRAGIWTDLIGGQNLEELLATSGPLSAGEAARIGLDLCRALAAVHSAGLVHRDVKTTNVMRERGGRTVLMDFGAGAEQHPGDRAVLVEDGTPLTMAPEELRGEPATPASDLYSLGVLLYRLVSGRFPIEARTYDELHALQDRGEHTPLRDLRPDLPPAFVQVVERALEASTERRFATAGEFERALMQCDGLKLGDASPSTRWSVGRRAMAWGVASVALAASFMLVIFHPWDPRPNEGGPGATRLEIPPARAGSVDTPSERGRDDAGAVTAQLSAGPLVASAALVLSRGDRNQALAPGDGVVPGDALSLSFQASEPVHVYVLDEDAAGEVYVLFPAPGVELANPLAPGVLHRLPGAKAGQAIRWQVTSAGGKETVIVIATREPFRALEREIARFPQATLDRPIVYAKLGESALETLRGIGGMTEGEPATGNASSPKLSDAVRRLAAGAPATAPWTWQIELSNPR